MEICVCGKICYRNWEHANADREWVIAKSHGKRGRVEVYICRLSGGAFFHIGHNLRSKDERNKKGKKKCHKSKAS